MHDWVVAARWGCDDDGWSPCVQGMETTPSTLVRIPYGNDQNDGWGAPPISGQANTQDRKKSVIGDRSKITLEQPLNHLTAASHVIDMRIDKKKRVSLGLPRVNC